MRISNAFEICDRRARFEPREGTAPSERAPRKDSVTLRAKAGIAVVIAVAGVGALLATHRVDDSLTAADREYIPKYLVGISPVPPAARRTYSQEVAFVRNVQQAVLRIAPRNEGLPDGTLREPRELFEAGRGLCYDRSRVIEKILRFAGFQTRHVAIYSLANGRGVLRTLATRQTPSHAVSEVRTHRGWLVVDSNDPWIAIDAAGQPRGIVDIHRAATGSAAFRWLAPIPNDIYKRPFTFVYGLYSRHGQFYPPYDAVPDVNYSEFAANF